MHTHSILSMLAGLLLSGTALSAATPNLKDSITSRQVTDSSALNVVNFDVAELNVAEAAHELYECNPDEEDCEPLVQPDDTTGTYNICPPGQHYQKSECAKGSLLQVTCRDGNGRDWRKWLRCQPHEICIQNSLEPPYARCKPIVDLVLWYTNTAGGTTSSTKYVHSVNKNVKTKVGNMYYDRNQNLVKLSTTEFFHEPGNQDIGLAVDVNRAYSNEVDWRSTENVKVKVETGGSGNIAVYTFLL